MPKQPDFILFMTDQHRADYLGCMGHPVLRTPHIDAIAAQGTVWDRFYVASPVCMPNRSSFMTCRMPSSHGVRCNGLPLDRRNVTFVDLLRDAGYKTALIGKSHLQPFSGRAPMHARPETREGFHRAAGVLSEAVRHDLGTYLDEDPHRAAFDPDLPYYGFDHVELVTRHSDRCMGNYGTWLAERAPGADQLIGADNQLEHGYICPQAVRTALPEELYSTSYIAERAAAWLDANRDDDQPYFLMVSFPDPHHPFNPPGRYWDMYNPADMTVPAAFETNDWSPPPHVAGVLQDRQDGRANLKGMGAIGTSVQEALEAQALTCGMISMIDDAIGRVRAASKAREAVTVFTTDHGDNLGDHRMLFKGAASYEEITRVPFIWSDPEDPTPRRTDAMGQTLDIGTTILERAMIEPAIGMQGRALLSGGRDAVFIQYEHQSVSPGFAAPPRIHTLRDPDFRISLVDGVPWGELYDLRADPGEMRNLWDDTAAAANKHRLIERLLRQEIAHVDSAPFPTHYA